MAGDAIIVTYTTLGVSAAFAVVASFPALTGLGASESRTAQQAAQVTHERAYCQAHEKGVDCRCFAQKSGYLQSYQFEQKRGAYAGNRQDIARAQARQSCRTRA